MPRYRTEKPSKSPPPPPPRRSFPSGLGLTTNSSGEVITINKSVKVNNNFQCFCIKPYIFLTLGGAVFKMFRRFNGILSITCTNFLTNASVLKKYRNLRQISKWRTGDSSDPGKIKFSMAQGICSSNFMSKNSNFSDLMSCR